MSRKRRAIRGMSRDDAWHLWDRPPTNCATVQLTASAIHQGKPAHDLAAAAKDSAHRGRNGFPARQLQLQRNRNKDTQLDISFIRRYELTSLQYVLLRVYELFPRSLNTFKKFKYINSQETYFHINLLAASSRRARAINCRKRYH